jgi:23S rRNA (adenine1618-N6)-methyltransferase
VRTNPHGEISIDYADQEAVKALNQALLTHAYGIKSWDIPTGYLCPPIPGRSDYVHHLRDLLGTAGSRDGRVRVLDIGTGANCIYPLIGVREYGWRFVASEVDPVAYRWAKDLAASNPSVAGSIEIRQQSDRAHIFEGIIRDGDFFEASMCNPPFHASAEEARAANLRKRRNLGTGSQRSSPLNFGGKSGELWCRGGELGFALRMIAESGRFRDQCRWFTILVSRSAHLPRLQAALSETDATQVKIIDMAQGQKQSRILAWRYGRLRA